MAKLTEGQKAGVWLAVGGVVALGAGYMAWEDYGAYEQVRADIAAKQQEKEKNQAEIEKIPGVRREVVQFKEIVEVNSKILPTDADIYTFIRFLGKLEKEHNMTIKALPNFSVPENSKAITDIPMQLQLVGTMRGFLRFLNAIESHERLVSVTLFRVSPGQAKDASTEAIHDFSVGFKVHRYDAKAGGKLATIPAEEEAAIKSMASVKEFIREKAKPKVLEPYQLMPGRDGRRDPFMDPRRVIDTSSTVSESTVYPEQKRKLEALKVNLDTADVELRAFELAKEKDDFLLMAAQKKKYQEAKELLDVNLREVTKKVPAFTFKDLQDDFMRNVDEKYRAMSAKADQLQVGGQTGGGGIGAAEARRLLGELREMADNRLFDAAVDKGNQIAAYVAESPRVDDAAKPHLAEIKRIAEHARFQQQFERKGIVVKGIVRTPHTSAVILGERTLLPNKSLDAETVFLRAEEGGRLVFRMKDHEVDYIVEPPKIISSEWASLEDY